MINLKKELLKYDELYCKYQSYLGRKTINNRTINSKMALEKAKEEKKIENKKIDIMIKNNNSDIINKFTIILEMFNYDKDYKCTNNDYIFNNDQINSYIRFFLDEKSIAYFKKILPEESTKKLYNEIEKYINRKQRYIKYKLDKQEQYNERQELIRIKEYENEIKSLIKEIDSNNYSKEISKKIISLKVMKKADYDLKKQFYYKRKKYILEYYIYKLNTNKKIDRDEMKFIKNKDKIFYKYFEEDANETNMFVGMIEDDILKFYLINQLKIINNEVKEINNKIVQQKIDKYMKDINYYIGYTLREEIEQNLIKDMKLQFHESFFTNDRLEKAREELVANFNSFIDEKNNNFVLSEIKKLPECFNNFEGKCLDAAQSEIVVVDEYNNRIIAPAGSGKTFLMLAKINYLLKKGEVNEDEILVFSFTNKTVEDITNRLTQLGYENVKVSTFHHFAGADLVKKYNKGVRECETKVIVKDVLRENECNDEIMNLIDKYNYNFQPIDKEKEYFGYSVSINDNRHNLNTIYGDCVKSYEEKKIANFLEKHSISYLYEPMYPFGHDVYKPDFYLLDYDVYIEHYGINRYGNNNNYSPKENAKYNEEIEWKRNIHKKYNTKLIETFSWENEDRVLEKRLEEKLQFLNIPLGDVRYNRLLSIMQLNKDNKYLQNKIIQIIELLQRKNLEIDFNKEPFKSLSIKSSQVSLLLKIVQIIHVKYKTFMNDNKYIDFYEEINQATEIIKNGKVEFNSYKYIFIDEFQDVEEEIVYFIQTLREANSSKLFCVGDDWQSIYKFKGANPKFFIDFEKYFGKTYTKILDTTFRFNNKLANLSSSLIKLNNNQLDKVVKSHRKEEDSSVPVEVIKVNKLNQKDEIEKILKSIPRNSEVLILNRRNESEYTWPIYKHEKIIDGNKKVNSMTIHKSKGLEADYVIIQENFTGEYNITLDDEKIIRRSIENNTVNDIEEERRVMYVALTRAKQKVFLLVAKDRSKVTDEVVNII